MKQLKSIRTFLVALILILGLIIYVNYGLSLETDNDKESIISNYEAQEVQEQSNIGDKIKQIASNLIANMFDFPFLNNEESDSSDILTDTDNESDSFVIVEENNLEAVNLEYIVDGDTVIVTDVNGNEFKVRLIGLDTAESVHEDETRNTIYGTYASDYTKELLSSTDTLYLEYDEEKTDQYGRTLAYVWLTENKTDCNNMLNYIILRDGYAYHKEFEPNVKYSELFSSTCNHAMTINAGLWSYEEFDELWN